MALYQRILSVENVGVIHERFAVNLRLARQVEALYARAGRPGAAAATQRELRRLYAEFNRDLDLIARKAASESQARMRERLTATAVRADTGTGPHLRNLLRSRPLHRFGPLATGEVGIADESWLDRAINVRTPGYGPYWRAQEHGTGAEGVPSQVGRIIHGYFYGPGGQGAGVRPMAAYRGGGGPHPVFIPSSEQRGVRGGKGGRGEISVEIGGRHFIRDGANIAEIDWRRGIGALERQVDARLRSVVMPSGVRRGRRVRRP